jgi:hypothetical protein
MSTEPDTCLPTTVWYLVSENGEPLGQIYRRGVPEADAVVQGLEHFQTAQVVSFTELRATCAMRRFTVVVRVLS